MDFQGQNLALFSRCRFPRRRLERDFFSFRPDVFPDLLGGLRVHEQVLVVEAVLDDELEVLRPGGVEREDELFGRGVALKKRERGGEVGRG